MDNTTKDNLIENHAPIKKDGDVFPPKSYIIELTNYCNLKCTMCNFHSGASAGRREKGFMSASLATRLLAEISESSADKPWVALHGAGESLLHRDLIKILTSASQIQNLNMGFLTNAVLLDADTSEKILDTPISWIGFSIDGIDKEKFDRYRHGAKYEMVLRHALDFINLSGKYRPDLKISVNMTLQDEMAADVPEFVAFWLPLVHEVSVSPCRPVGSRDNMLVTSLSGMERVPCYMLYEMMVICWDGKVGLCCEDWFNSGNMGDALKNGIMDIWRGGKFRKARALHENGAFDKIPLCRNCNSWYNAMPQEFFDENLGCKAQRNAWQYIYKRR